MITFAGTNLKLMAQLQVTCLLTCLSKKKKEKCASLTCSGCKQIRRVPQTHEVKLVKPPVPLV